MLFGIVWNDGRGARSPERQHQRLADLGVDQRRIVGAVDDLPPLRPGDELVTCTLMALTDDPVKLSQLYRELMREGARLNVDGVGEYRDWDQFPELLAAHQKARRRKQTAAARAKSRPPSKGPKTDPAEIRKVWRDPAYPTKQAVADAFGVTWATVNRWQSELKLGPKAKPE